MKKILILGGTAQQIKLVEAAKKIISKSNTLVIIGLHNAEMTAKNVEMMSKTASTYAFSRTNTIVEWLIQGIICRLSGDLIYDATNPYPERITIL